MFENVWNVSFNRFKKQRQAERERERERKGYVIVMGLISKMSKRRARISKVKKNIHASQHAATDPRQISRRSEKTRASVKHSSVCLRVKTSNHLDLPLISVLSRRLSLRFKVPLAGGKPLLTGWFTPPEALENSSRELECASWRSSMMRCNPPPSPPPPPTPLTLITSPRTGKKNLSFFRIKRIQLLDSAVSPRSRPLNE